MCFCLSFSVTLYGIFLQSDASIFCSSLTLSRLLRRKLFGSDEGCGDGKRARGESDGDEGGGR